MDDSALADFLHFDETDLYDNRNGRLSERQQLNLLEEYKSGRRSGFVSGLGCGVFFFAAASVFPILITPQALAALQKGNQGEAIGMFIGIGVWVLIWGGIGCIGFRSAISSITKKRPTFSLQSLVGPINIVGVEKETSSGSGIHRTTSTYIQHELRIGRQKFEVEGDLGGFLMQGDTYAIYYIDKDQIMSMERVSKA